MRVISLMCVGHESALGARPVALRATRSLGAFLILAVFCKESIDTVCFFLNGAGV
jgi:hypothetical protein